MAPVKLKSEENLIFKNTYIPKIPIMPKIPVTINIAVMSTKANLNTKDVKKKITGELCTQDKSEIWLTFNPAKSRALAK